MAKRKWHEIALDYETTELTVEELAQKWGVPVRTLRRHCCEERWVERREEYREALAQKARHDLRAKLAREWVDRTKQDLAILHRLKVALVNEVEGGIKANSLDAVVGKVVDVMRAERMIMGEATEHTVCEHVGDGGGPVQIEYGMSDVIGDPDLRRLAAEVVARASRRETEPGEPGDEAEPRPMADAAAPEAAE